MPSLVLTSAVEPEPSVKLILFSEQRPADIAAAKAQEEPEEDQLQQPRQVQVQEEGLQSEPYTRQQE